jgi:hypothetical protein
MSSCCDLPASAARTLGGALLLEQERRSWSSNAPARARLPPGDRCASCLPGRRIAPGWPTQPHMKRSVGPARLRFHGLTRRDTDLVAVEHHARLRCRGVESQHLRHGALPIKQHGQLTRDADGRTGIERSTARAPSVQKGDAGNAEGSSLKSELAVCQPDELLRHLGVVIAVGSSPTDGDDQPENAQTRRIGSIEQPLHPRRDRRASPKREDDLYHCERPEVAMDELRHYEFTQESP